MGGCWSVPYWTDQREQDKDLVDLDQIAFALKDRAVFQEFVGS